MTCSTCVHFEQAKPYRWGACKHPLPWWVLPISPTVHPEDNNAKDCDCYAPNAGLEPRGNRVGSEPLLADSQKETR